MTILELPRAMAGVRAQLPGIVAGLEARVPYAAVLLSAQQGLLISVDDQQEQVAELPPSAGTAITAFDGMTLHEVALGGFDAVALERGARDLVRPLAIGAEHAIDPGPERRGDFVTPMQIPPQTLRIEEKLDLVRELHRRARDRDPRIVNVVAAYTERGEVSIFCNRAADLAQRVQRMRLSLQIVVEGPNGARFDWATKTSTGGWETLSFSDEEIQSVVDSAVALLGAERIEPGEYTIITAPGVTGTICHESFGHGVETDMFLKQRAKAAHFVDKVVGSPLVNIWDDPSYPGAHGSYFFDDEGMLAAPTCIVNEGVFRGGISDLYSSIALGVPRTGHGRRQDFSRKTYARMANTFFAAGTTPVTDLFAQVDRGVYLERWSSGMEDPQGWGIQVTCLFGREIRNGAVTGRVFAPIGISGYVPDVLASISAVGDDWLLEGGGCGKGHKEFVRVSAGGPHLLLKARLG